MPRGFASPEKREKNHAGARRGNQAMNTARQALKAKGMAAAIEWRESRRCKEPVMGGECGALAYESCAHRPNGLQS